MGKYTQKQPGKESTKQATKFSSLIQEIQVFFEKNTCFKESNLINNFKKLVSKSLQNN